MHGFRSKVILSIWICIFCFCTAGNCKYIFLCDTDHGHSFEQYVLYLLCLLSGRLYRSLELIRHFHSFSRTDSFVVNCRRISLTVDEYKKEDKSIKKHFLLSHLPLSPLMWNWNIEPWRAETNLSVVLAKACPVIQ